MGGSVVHGTVRRVDVQGHVSRATNGELTGIVWSGINSSSSPSKSD
jgi:hypothetical protein